MSWKLYQWGSMPGCGISGIIGQVMQRVLSNSGGAEWHTLPGFGGGDNLKRSQALAATTTRNCENSISDDVASIGENIAESASRN